MIMMLLFILFCFLMIILTAVFLGVWVYKDAKARNLNAGLWTAIVILAPNFIGFLLYFLVGRKQTMIICGSCHSNVPYRSKFCPNCGKEIDATVDLSASAKSNKKFIIGVFVCIFAILVAFSIFTASLFIMDGASWNSGISIGSVNYSWDSEWSVSFYKSTADYGKTIRINDGYPSFLNINYRCESGKLFLQLKQGSDVYTVPLDGESGELRYDLSEFDDGSVKLYIKNTNAKNASVKISWE